MPTDPQHRGETKAGASLGALAARLSRNVARLRVRRGLSRSALSRRAGLGESVVALIEKRAHAPNVRTVEKLAAALEVEPEELLLDLDGEDGDQ